MKKKKDAVTDSSGTLVSCVTLKEENGRIMQIWKVSLEEGGGLFNVTLTIFYSCVTGEQFQLINDRLRVSWLPLGQIY